MSINHSPTAGEVVTPRGKGSGKGKKALTITLSLLGVWLLLFGGGFFVGRNGLNAAKADLAKNKSESKRLMAQAKGEIEQAKDETRSVQSRLTAEQAKLQVADARNLLYKCAVQIDQRNFGTAQTNLKQASDILESGAMEAAGFAAVQSQAVKTALKSMDLSAAGNGETQRAQLLTAAGQMDAMFDALPKPEAAQTAPTDSPSGAGQGNP